MRFLAVLKGDEDPEARKPPSPELMAKMGDFMEEVTREGILLATDGLQPSSQASRLRLKDGKLTVTDGPFAVTREVLASYALFNVTSRQEGIHWTSRFLQVLGEGEVDIYPIFEWSDDDLSTAQEHPREAHMHSGMNKNAQIA